MTHNVRSAIIAVTGFVEGAALLYLAFVVWLFTGWFVDDNAAFRMTDADWIMEGVKRVANVALYATILGLIVYVVNRLVAYATGYRTSRLPRYSALAFVAVIVLAAIVAAVGFVLKKPYL